MKDADLRRKIESSLGDGFTEQQIRKVLRDKGVSSPRLDRIFNQIQQSRPQENQKGRQRENRPQTRNTESRGQNVRGQGRSPGGAIPGLDLTDSYYRIKQSFLLRRYNVYDRNDKPVLKAKNKLLSLKTRIPFRMPDKEETVFTVESERLFNISNNYNVTLEDGSEIAVIDRKRTLFNQVWRVRNPGDDSLAAEIKTANQAAMIIRILGSRIPLLGILTSLIPHTYVIEDKNGQQIGELEGKLSIKDTYDLELEDSGELDREAMIASVISIDAIEGQ